MESDFCNNALAITKTSTTPATNVPGCCSLGYPTGGGGDNAPDPAAPWGQSNRVPRRHCHGLMNCPCQIPRLAFQASSSAATYRFE